MKFYKSSIPIFLICTTILIYTNTAISRIEKGLVSVWTFDKNTISGDTVEDTFGENNGTITGDPEVVEGRFGEALSFDGVVDYVTIEVDIEPESVTMEALIKPVLDSRNPIFDKYNYGIQLPEAMDTVGVWIRDDKVQWPSAYTSYPKDGDWHYVTGIVRDKESVKIYLDGELKNTAPAPNPIDKAYSALKPTIAYTQHLGGIWYHGIIDEVAIYDRALSELEVQNNYTQLMAVSPNGNIATTWGQLKY